MHLKKINIHSRRFPTKDCYPFNLEIFQKTKTLGFPQPVTFFVGENGTGKSTLLKAVALRCAIHMWRDEEGYERRVYYQNQYAEELYNYLKVESKIVPARIPSLDSHISRY